MSAFGGQAFAAAVQGYSVEEERGQRQRRIAQQIETEGKQAQAAEKQFELQGQQITQQTQQIEMMKGYVDNQMNIQKAQTESGPKFQQFIETMDYQNENADQPTRNKSYTQAASRLKEWSDGNPVTKEMFGDFKAINFHSDQDMNKVKTWLTQQGAEGDLEPEVLEEVVTGAQLFITGEGEVVPLSTVTQATGQFKNMSQQSLQDMNMAVRAVSGRLQEASVAKEVKYNAEQALVKSIQDDPDLSVEQKTAKLQELYATKTEKSARQRTSAPTYVEEYKSSMDWMSKNKDKKGSDEWNKHQGIVTRFEGKQPTSSQRDIKSTEETYKAVRATEAYTPEGKLTPAGEDADVKVRSNPKIYTSKIQNREVEAYDTAQSYANLQDIKKRLDTGIASGKYKSGYLDSVADWMQSKVGGDFIKKTSAGEVGSELQTRLGVDGELAIELGRVVKAAYGGNASNTDRETIAGAMAGMSSDDEATRKIAFDNFNRSIRKLVSLDVKFMEDTGLYVTASRLKDTMDVEFTGEGDLTDKHQPAPQQAVPSKTQGKSYDSILKRRG